MKDKEYKDDDVIVIGGSQWKRSAEGKDTSKDYRKWKMAAILFAAALLLLGAFFLGKHIYYNHQFNRSRPDSEIFTSLSEKMPGKAGITLELQEAMGGKMNIYRLSGLRAHFADTVPDYSDSSVYFITRSADYKIQNGQKQIIGDYIDNGRTLSDSQWRAGFMAIMDGNAQIGISRSSRFSKYMKENGGSMFRQMALVSAGTPCSKQFILKGKVTRCAYARDIEGNLYFVETINPETLYGFADALIEYGFIDAVYVTGGKQPNLFHRSADGTVSGHFIDDKPHELVVWTR